MTLNDISTFALSAVRPVPAGVVVVVCVVVVVAFAP